MNYTESIQNKQLFHICLVEPEIPNNTGNIGRTCVGLCSKLHIIEPMAFEIDDKRVRRAGLDYWPNLNWERHPSFEEWLPTVPDKKRMFLFTTKASKSFYDVDFEPGDYLVFGKETKGLSADFRGNHIEQCVHLPMLGEIRSFNLANAVSVAAFEAFRQVHKKYQK